ncbi:hypothetical protein [Helicobacter brantae]|uniref:Uncharacterized protein n=1 Tax=Helicobacter brantae TaxID=375927 RepID=A0A3D8IYF4_9HELI|nr:hypothetical protein [Helicobacter brantae]RDU70297.1 hypothetical protein CQA58_06120 [Helicobacter brantae]
MGVIIGSGLSALIGIVCVVFMITFVGKMIFKMIFSILSAIFLLIAIYFGYQWYMEHKSEVDERIKKELSSKENQELIKKIQGVGDEIKDKIKEQLK